jgi:propionyl-CoA carboxylase alpha chain
VGRVPALTMARFRRILIANRGEIAIRIARTCREMGISPVMVYADADREALHTRAGHAAVAIGASYLGIAAILEAARKIGVDAVHPGYGFLAENADFAEACERAGVAFIGPSAAAIRGMGLKIEARAIARSAGVPVVPDYQRNADIEFPVLIKASAGGGGRGMRIVRERGEFEEAWESAEREARRSFADGTLLIEKYIEHARHIEFQIFGDAHGNLIELGERDCTIQRRFQKIIEESPSPCVDAPLRRRMADAALAVGRAIEYTNAGTVEFLLAPSGEFYFIEVNTRIQVEHPVTEMVTGLDLVRLQIEVAEGARLPAELPTPRGHAIEARLYAEDPANDFLPSAGTIEVWRPPPGVRVDSGIEEGAEIGVDYDPLLAKLISVGADREEAVRKLAAALRATVVLGIDTNREYLIEQLGGDRTASQAEIFRCSAVVYSDVMRGPLAGYRNNPYRDARVRRVAPNRYLIDGHAVHVVRAAPGRIDLVIDGVLRSCEIKETPACVYVWSAEGACTLKREVRFPRARPASERETANSPMPGRVLRILVEAGQSVKMGDAIVVLEAMKMEQTIRTTINGVVQAVLVKPGQVVAPGQMLVEISAKENAE